MKYNSFDICEAYYLVEVDYNNGGWLQERPSNRRRMEATHIQLARLRFKPAMNLSYESLTENGKEIYDEQVRKLNLSCSYNQSWHFGYTYTSVFDDGITCESNCKYDAEKKRVYDIDDAANSDEADDANSLTDEYVTVNGVQLREADGVQFDY